VEGNELVANRFHPIAIMSHPHLDILAPIEGRHGARTMDPKGSDQISRICQPILLGIEA
jgi:hypothetical protein